MALGPVTEIVYWWDKHLKLWTIIMRDSQRNQIDNARWVPNKQRLNYFLSACKEDYKCDNVRRLQPEEE